MKADSLIYLLRHAVPFLANNHKVEVVDLLPFLALGLLPEHFDSHAGMGIVREIPKRVVLDVGAHIGTFSTQVMRLMTGLAESNYRSHSGDILRNVAVEPSPGKFKEMNTRAERLDWGDKFCGLNIALGNVPKESVPFAPESIVSRVLKPSEVGNGSNKFANYINVNQSTIDLLFDAHHCGLSFEQEVYILKIDCEGSEHFILHGAKNLLQHRKIRFLLLEYSPVHLALYGYRSSRHHSPEVFLNELWQFGFGCFLLMDRFLVPLSGRWFDQAYRGASEGGVVYVGDLLCARPDDPLLKTIIEGFATNIYVKEAKAIAYEAVEDWRLSMGLTRPTVHDLYGYELRVLKFDMVPLDYWSIHGGYSQRTFRIGELLANGLEATPSTKELKEARYWLTRSSLHGFTAAMLTLAGCYHFGTCAPQNYSKAFMWYQKAYYADPSSFESGVFFRTISNLMEKR